MNKLKMEANGISIEVIGNDELIQKERSEFLKFIHDNNLIHTTSETKSSTIEAKASGLVSGDMISTSDATNHKCSNDSNDSIDDVINDQNGNIDFVRTVEYHHETNWQKLVEGIKNGIPVEIGSTVLCSLTDGTKTEFVVTDVTDQYVRFETKNFIGEKVSWNTNTNDGGYPKSEIKRYVDTTIWNLLPEDLQNVISTVNRTWKDSEGRIGTYKTKLFLPSVSEVFNDFNCFGDKELYTQLDYYKDVKNRSRVNENGDIEDWWLGTVRNENTYRACFVSEYGSVGGCAVCGECNLTICFQISKI